MQPHLQPLQAKVGNQTWEVCIKPELWEEPSLYLTGVLRDWGFSALARNGTCPGAVRCPRCKKGEGESKITSRGLYFGNHKDLSTFSSKRRVRDCFKGSRNNFVQHKPRITQQELEMLLWLADLQVRHWDLVKEGPAHFKSSSHHEL